ncbi:ChaN family lipoprotein [Pseudovibrio sp. FO-BEG1]|uniref:ChaN family lipoprotein n=1 Tax=Pseudovibrio sp. (strain FO-BEG1) TaxID=911045 RepID=UPI00059F1506|nr:ChaN family lipoprotein [Pseudovibrio sp. FO-BEG1]
MFDDAFNPSIRTVGKVPPQEQNMLNKAINVLSFAVAYSTLVVSSEAASGQDGGAQDELSEKPKTELILMDHPLVDTIWDLRTGKQISQDAFWKLAVTQDHLLVGEKHDNPRHHEIQVEAVHQMGVAGRKPLIVMEMVDPKHQQWLKELKPEDVSGLSDKLEWEKRGWPAWSMYEPIFKEAAFYGMTIAPGAPERELLIKVGTGGVPSEDVSKDLMWSQKFSKKQHESLLDELERSHCGVVPRNSLEPLVEMQRLKDASMGLPMRSAMKTERGSVLIAGTGHTRKDRGVPWWLDRNDSRLSLAAVEVSSDNYQLSDYSLADVNRFDYVWFTGRVESVDPCEKYAEQLKTMGKKHTHKE